MKTVRLGKYKHYKGKIYEVIGVAKHSETLKELVVYRELYDDYGLWVRPKEVFMESIEVKGKRVPRFLFIE